MRLQASHLMPTRNIATYRNSKISIHHHGHNTNRKFVYSLRLIFLVDLRVRIFFLLVRPSITCICEVFIYRPTWMLNLKSLVQNIWWQLTTKYGPPPGNWQFDNFMRLRWAISPSLRIICSLRLLSYISEIVCWLYPDISRHIMLPQSCLYMALVRFQGVFSVVFVVSDL